MPGAVYQRHAAVANTPAANPRLFPISGDGEAGEGEVYDVLSAASAWGRSAGAGASRSARTGEQATHRNAVSEPSAPVASVARSPISSPSRPTSRAPTGIVPQTTKRIVAFIRPCNRSGTIAWRRLSWFTS